MQPHRDTGYRHGHGEALAGLGAAQRLAGDYPAAAAALRQARELFRDLDEPF